MGSEKAKWTRVEEPFSPYMKIPGTYQTLANGNAHLIRRGIPKDGDTRFPLRVALFRDTGYGGSTGGLFWYTRRKTLTYPGFSPMGENLGKCIEPKTFKGLGLCIILLLVLYECNQQLPQYSSSLEEGLFT